jgi:hypothetical protein
MPEIVAIGGLRRMPKELRLEFAIGRSSPLHAR